MTCRLYCTPRTIAHALAAICHSAIDLDEKQWADIFEPIKTVDFFREFLVYFGYICTMCIGHPMLTKTRAISLILKYAATSVIDPLEIAKLFLTVVTTALFPMIPPAFPLKSCTFFEVSSLPDKLREILVDTKELVALHPKDEQLKDVLLTGILDTESPWRRYVCGEFLSAMEIEEQDYRELADKVMGTELYRGNFAKLRSMAILLRLCPSLYKSYEKQIDEIITPEISDWAKKEKLNASQREGLSDIMIAIMGLHPASINNFEVPILTMIRDADRNLLFMIPVFQAGYDAASATLKQAIQSAFAKRLSTADGIPTLMRWDEMVAGQQQQPRTPTFGKWTTIRYYWSLLFLVSPDEAVTLDYVQLKDLSRGILDVNRATFIKSFKLIAGQITNDVVVPYLIERGIYDKVMQAFLELYQRYNASLNSEDYALLVEGLSNGGENGVEFAKNSFANDLKAPIMAKGISLATDDFKSKLFTDKAYVESKLAISGSLTVEQLCLTYAACSYGRLLEDDDLMKLVSNVILESLTLRPSAMIYVDYFLKLVAEKVAQLKPDFVVAVIKKVFESLSGLLCHLAEPIIHQFVDICKLDDIKDCTFAKKFVVKLYIQRVVLPYMKKHTDEVDAFLEYVADNVETTVAATFVFMNSLPSFKVSSTKAIALFKQCTKDEDAYEVFEIWAKSEDDGGFDEMFQIFLNSITVYMSSHQKNACEHIRIPKKCSLSDVLNALVKTILNFQKFPAVFCPLWAIIANNLSVIPNPLVTLWPLFLRQTLNIKPVGKKTQMAHLAPILSHLTDLLCSSNPPENKDHHAIVYLSNFLVHSLRTVLEQQPAQTKCITPMIKCATLLVERFGSQVPILSVFCKMLLMFYQKQHNTPSQTTNPPASVPQVTPSPVVAASHHALAQQMLGRVLIQSQQQKGGGTIHSIAAALQQPLSQALQQKVVAPQTQQSSVSQQPAQNAVARPPVARPNQQAAQQHADTIDFLIGCTHKMLEIGLENEKNLDLDAIVELLYSVVQNQSSQIWSCAVLSLHFIASTGLCTEKLTGYAKGTYTDEIMLRFFPLFWCYEPVSELRMTKYLPFAIRMMGSEATDHTTMKFLLATMLETILAYPFNNSLDLIVSELVSGKHHFRSFFVKYFVTKDQMDKNSVIAIGELLRKCGLTSDKMLGSEIRNADLRKYIHGLSCKKYNRQLLIFGKYFDVDQYPHLTNWEVADSLLEGLRTDFQAGVKKFTTSQKYLQFNMFDKALKAVTDDVTLADHDIIYQMNLDHYLIPQELIANCGEYLPQIGQYKNRCVAELQLRPSSLFTEGFAKYCMITALFKVMKGEKASLQVFLKPLPAEFAPHIHITFHKLRVAALTFLKTRRDVTVNDEPHVRAFRRSIENTFTEPRLPFPPLSQQLEQKDMRSTAISQMLLTLASQVGRDDWHSLVIKMAIDGAKLRPTDNVIMMVLMTMLERYTEETTAKLLEAELHKFNEFWSYHLNRIITEKPEASPLLQWLHVSFYTRHIIRDGQSMAADLMNMMRSIDTVFQSIITCSNAQRMFNGESFDQYGSIDTLNLCKGFQLPLYPQEKIAHILPSLEFSERQSISFFVRTMSGRRLRLLILNRPMMTPQFNMFSHYLNECFYNYSGTKLRGQCLSAAYSISLGGGYHLAKGNWIPITDSRERQRPFELSKISVTWHALFAERYAALSAVQILLGGAKLNQATMFIDYDELLVSVPDIPRGNVVLSIDGHLKNYLNSVLVKGPYKHGILASFLCFSLFRKEILAYLEILTNEPVSMQSETIRTFSIDESPVETVCQTLDDLIQKSNPASPEIPRWY